MKNKILVATDSFLPKIDGVSMFLTRVLPKLANYYDITLLCPGFPGKIKEFKGIKIIRTKVSRIKIANYNIPKPKNKQIKKLVEEADLVWLQDIGPVCTKTLKFAKLLNKKIIAYVHAIEGQRFSVCSEATSKLRLILSSLTRNYERNFYTKCNRLMLSSNTISKILYKEGIHKKETIIPLGVDSLLLKPTNKEQAKKKLNLEGKFVIGYLGRISKEKNLITLRNVFADLPIENKFLLIVGGGAYLQRRMFNGIKNVKITGFVDDKNQYLQAMDVYVLPSLTETSSLSTLEAMSSGLPVVTTPVGAIPDYLIDGKNGMFFNVKAEDELFKILIKLYGNKDLRDILGSNARKTASKFSWDITVKKIKTVFDEELN
ncbi:MAG: glycosyltransferase family 4 protein [Candidatus Nanoarchaeia archaeon]|nr:glycosyltransferase family 4 protein [Candidatus Nanoarchaeia archaeon]